MRVPSPRQPRLKHSRARFVAYTEREWGEIKSALQYLGKDADAITVRVGTMDTEEIKSAIAAIRVAKERGECSFTQNKADGASLLLGIIAHLS